jgi:hypothetical protein
MINFKTIKTAFNVISTVAKIAGAAAVVKEVHDLVPPATRKKISKGFKSAKEKSRTGLATAIQTVLPGVAEEILDRNTDENAIKAAAKQDEILEALKELQRKPSTKTAVKKTAPKKK